MLDVLTLLTSLGIAVEKRHGARLWAKCPSPDHDDHDPSWFIWNTPGDAIRNGKHRCYGCGWRGGPLALVRAVRGGDWYDARTWLETGDSTYTPLQVAVEIREIEARARMRAPEWVQFGDTFDAWPTLAVRYLTGPKRRLGIETVKRWGLGFITKGERKLAGRIWIPIRDMNGTLVSWQARSYVDSDLRYMTPEAHVPVLYGTEHWPVHEDRDVVVVVEGPFDALSVDRATRLPVGAIIGSNPTSSQISAMATFRHVVVMTDADPAGDKVWDQLQGVRRWTQLTRMRLPDGCDPGGSSDAQLRNALSDFV